MIIELQRQWFPGALMANGDLCGVCGQPVEEQSIAACAVTDWRTDMGLACLSCVEYLGRRNPEKFPTIEVYRELLARYPEPMYESEEALEADAEEYEDPAELVWDDSWVWSAQDNEDDLVHITPTVLYRVDQGGERLTAAVVEKPEKGRALLVFRSEEEAEKYRAATGKQPEEEGFKPVSVELEDLANIIAMHACTHVAMPEPWTGKGGVDFFKAPDFIGMLRESAPA